MGDIAKQLEAVASSQEFDDDEDIIREGIAEIIRLRTAIRRLAAQDATLSACNGNVTVTMDATLTDAEREAIEWYAAYGRGNHADTLRGLLERLAVTEPLLKEKRA